MKKIILGLALMITGSYCVKSQGLDGLVVEKFYVTNAADAAANSGFGTALPAGSVVWRFYADLASGWELQSVYGDPNHTLTISTTTAFFNNTDRGSEFGNGLGANFIDDNTVYIDSYISLGASAANRSGVVKTEDDNINNLVNSSGILANNDPSAGFPLTQRDGQTSAVTTPAPITPAGIAAELGLFSISPTPGNIFQTNNGAWATTGSAVGPTATNRVLIAQITSDGVLTYAFNLQVRNITTLAVENWVSSNPVGSELLMASLAGVVNQANALPSVSITSPSNGATFLVGQSVAIDATASDTDGSISNVEFLVDNVVVGSDNTSPYSFTWTAVVGSHNLTARATDNLGGQATSSAVNVVVGNVVPPAVSITAPATGSTFVLGDNVNITASASDADGSVTQVEFFVGATSVGIDNTAPYSASWPAAIGNFNITAVATDDDNATTTSSAVSISVFDSSSAYVLVSSTNPCSANNFCLPLTAIVPVNDVIGYDIVLEYDNTKVTPTGVVTVDNDLINPAHTSTANSIDNANGIMYISVFFNAGAPINAEFNGTGQLLCVEFARIAGFGAEDTADFSVSSLQESYFNGVQPKVVSPGQYATFQEGSYSSNLKFWFDNSPIRYDINNPSAFLITNITGNNLTCTSPSLTAVQPDLAGNFVHDIDNGDAISINKDIPGATSVQPVVNGFDAFLTRRVLVNDGTFLPTVYQMIAMDVNIDGVISAGDLSQINQRAVLIIDEFRQAWNYNAAGVSNGQPSKDWLFIDGTTLNNDPAYQISATYPFDDGSGYHKGDVPVTPFCLEVPVFTSTSCSVFGIESYTGILMGDVNGNYATAVPNNIFKTTSKVVFDLAKAEVGNGFIEVPVAAISADEVNAIDFAMQFDMNKLNYSSVIVTGESVESLSNFNSADQSLRFTSYSLQNYDLSGYVAKVRFATQAAELTQSDIFNLEAYINGEPVAATVIGNRMVSESGMMVSVYPNPSSSVLNIVSTEAVSYELFNLGGQVVASEDEVNAYETHSLNIGDLAAGIYTLKVYNSGAVKMVKVVIE